MKTILSILAYIFIELFQIPMFLFGWAVGNLFKGTPKAYDPYFYIIAITWLLIAYGIQMTRFENFKRGKL